MRICLLSVAWVMKQAAPMAARQKAVSSGLTPAARQFLEIRPMTDQAKTVSRIRIRP